MNLDLWKVLEDDPRWKDADADLAPASFNPDRYSSNLVSISTEIEHMLCSSERSLQGQLMRCTHCVCFRVCPNR